MARLVANLFCLPIADKLHVKLLDEETNRTLIIDGILMIRDSKSPALVREMLLAYLPEKHRETEEANRCRPSRSSTHGPSTMAKKKRAAAHGGHGWFVTFADLMALLVSFFVMLVAFSTQDQQKLKIVAGSMREAFGVQTESRFSGIIETEGLATRTRLKHLQQNPDEAKNPTIPDQVERSKLDGARLKVDREFALASASLRQALQDMPELTEMSKHIMFEETKEGLNLEIVDQDGRSMFPDGSKEPYERTRLLIQKLAAPLRATPLRVAIIGHTSASHMPQRSDYTAFDLSADRANAVRQVLQQERASGLALLHGCGQGRHPAAVSGRSESRGKPPRDHHADARRSAAAAQFEAVACAV